MGNRTAGPLHLFIADEALCVVLQSIDPAVADTVGELLFLSP